MDPHKKVNGINRRFVDRIRPGGRILDYGCGQGAVTRILLDLDFVVIAADIDPGCEAMIRSGLSSAESERFRFVRIDEQDGSELGAPESFDCIICREVLEHVEDPQAIVAQFSRALRPEGLLILSVPSDFTERYFSRWDPDWLEKSEHLRVFRKNDIPKLLNDHRLMLVAKEGQSFRWTLFWSMLVPFRVEHVMGNPSSHPRLVRFTHRLLQWVFMIPGIEKLGNQVLPKSFFFYAVKRRPRVMVVYDYRDWILGKWASNIRRIHGRDFDIVEMSMFHAQRERRYAEQLAARFDIIHLLLPHPYQFFRSVAPQAAFITTIHHWVTWGEYAQAAAESAHVVTGAREWKERLVNRGVDADRITVVHSGVEARYFEDHPPLLETSPKWTVGFFAKKDSNEQDRKGTRHFLALARYIHERGLPDRFRWVISGIGWDNEVRTLKSLGAETVYFPYVEEHDMPGLYRSLDAYLMLSDVEGGPVTIAEAMASSCLVFTTNIGVARDIVDHGVTGVVVNNSDPAGILEKMLWYNANPDQAEQVRQNARRLAESQMRYNQTLEPLGDLYAKIFNDHARFADGPLDTKRENQLTIRKAKMVKP